ncbi:MAG: hypothetical protein AAF483_03245 [Planctomycetota bacterium]
MNRNRREFLNASALGVASCIGTGPTGNRALGQEQVQQPKNAAVTVELPRGRVPLSFIIDDSTCLVNMGKFCMPQFAATYPERASYHKPWQDWPDEIPDSFVREFGQWCAEHGVKGKYSVVPYPACVGWLDRTLPGWSQKQLQDSLKLVRDLMLPNWDIHPEMITHTRVIDLKTGRPFQDYSPAHMENSYPQEDVSVDYLASYLAYALQIVKNCDLPCEGITTPGGFGNRVKAKLPVAVGEAVRDVYGCELPHYFKYLEDATWPKMEGVSGKQGGRRAIAEDQDLYNLVVNVPAGTGDWFGGWDGVLEPQAEKYCDQAAASGRMVELIEAKQPAVMLCHWPGMYCNGSKSGFRAFQSVVQALANRFGDQTQWMKISEIARYWAAKEYTRVRLFEKRIELEAPFACPQFTLRLPGSQKANQASKRQKVPGFKQVSTLASLLPGYVFYSELETWLCLDLAKGSSQIELGQS